MNPCRCTECKQEWIGDVTDHKCMPKKAEKKMTKAHNTTVKTKQDYWPVFAKLIENQFNHGGDKYKLQGFDDRESTDIISSVFGGPDELDWIRGTMVKYIFRHKTLGREKDWLKIATYAFIGWLKQGCHLQKDHDEDTKK